MKKVISTLVVILWISVGVIFTVSNGMSQVQTPEVQAVNTPQIIVLGNPATIPLQLILQLPVGFSWTASRDLPFSIDTGDLEDPRALFVLDDATDVNEVVTWAAKAGKKEVYFLYTPPLPPDVEVVPFDLTELNWTEWKDSFSEFISPTEAWADMVPDRFCTGNLLVPAGSCVYGGCVKDSPLCDHNVVDDDTTDSRRPNVTVCIMYDSFNCHFTPMDYHIRRNIWLIGRDHNASGGGDTSFTDCMKIHNGRNFLKYPVGLTVRVWLTADDDGFEDFCGPDPRILACASRPRPLKTPRKSVDGLIYLPSEAANSWGVVRHEMAHTYGYNHCDMTRIDRLAHCIVGRSTGTNVPMSSDGTCPAEFKDRDEDLRICCKRGEFDGSDHTVE